MSPTGASNLGGGSRPVLSADLRGSHTILSFEGVRGVAAVLVALFHLKLGAAYFAPIRDGYLFVDLFFVLSGYVICANYATRLRTAEDFKSFLLRRFGRLYPLLIFSTAAYVIGYDCLMAAKRIAIANGHSEFLGNPGALDYLVPQAAEIWSTLTLTHGMGLFKEPILNVVSWSISAEFYAYILMAVICVFTRGRVRLAIFALAAAAGFLVTTWATLDLHDCLHAGQCFNVTADFGFARCVFSFFLGALACSAGNRIRFDPNALQAACLCLLAAVFAMLDRFPLLTLVLPLCFTLLVVSLRADSGALAALLTHRHFQMLGRHSYSIYMMHPVLLLFVWPIAKHANGFFMVAITMLVFFSILLFVSGLIYRTIEDPFRHAFNRMAERLRRHRLTVRRTAAVE